MRRWFWLASSLLILSLGAVWFIQGNRPVGGEAKRVEIGGGASRLAIATTLKAKGVIRSRGHFLLLLALFGGKVQAGTYLLNPQQSPFLIVGALRLGRDRFLTLTIPEGWRREEIAQALVKKGLDRSAFLAATGELEGYLFPDTYFLPLGAKTEQILEKFSTNFAARTKELNPSLEAIILASIIEREAKRDDQRPVIAAVFRNRLAKNLLLEADPTVQYGKVSNRLATGETVEEFWPPITTGDYTQVISPYNTYRRKGLPPGSIANPGLKSIEAAVHPATTDALYFFHTKDGSLVTSKSVEEHNSKKKKHL